MVLNEQRTLLIVEDEQELREILASFLSSLNLNILFAENGREALEKLQTNVVHAVATDIGMPVMDGLTLLGEIRKRYFDVPVVMITAFSDATNVKKALQLGAIDFVEKPYNENEVVETINRALDIGVRARMVCGLSEGSITPEGGEDYRVTELQKQRKMISLLQIKNGENTKKKAG